jgi:hypothetical protein
MVNNEFRPGIVRIRVVTITNNVLTEVFYNAKIQ